MTKSRADGVRVAQSVSVNRPIDENWRSIIEHLRVPSTEDLYILGSFARSVTVYSQQVRAIGLIDALAGMGRLRQSSRVAVIGGGISGLTAAASLAKIGVPVTVFETEGSLAPLQWNSDKRFLHPYIYDWPFTSIDETDAQLPVLNWHAQRASAVVQEMMAQWNKIAAEGVTIVPEKVEVVRRVRQFWRIQPGDREFDVVISCVGFGVESGESLSYPYWADLPLDDPQVHSKKWLVSGAGDGALTDLMRLCIPNFAHEDALRLVVKTVENTSGAELIDKIRARVTGELTGQALFEGLDSEAIAKALTLRSNSVTLNTSEAKLFGTPQNPARSSLLNRLVTWVLIRAGKAELLDGHIPSGGVTGLRGNYLVRVSSRSDPLPFDDILLRHGPNAPFGTSEKPRLPEWMDPALERQVTRLATNWDRLYKRKKTDPTLLQEHWDNEHMFDADRLAPDFRKIPGVLLYSSRVVGDEAGSFKNSVSAAIRNKKVLSALVEAFGLTYPHSASTEVSALRVEDLLNSPRAFGRAIRTLSDAPVAVFDGTEELPALMFLLGVRSVVRRGVTIVVRVGKLYAQAWRRVPFNLRELRLVTVSNRTDLNAENEIHEAAVEGLKLYARRPFHYSDLPAFGPIRNLGGHKDDYIRRTAKEQVLVLCPFDDNYTKKCWPELQRAIRDRWSPDDKIGPARRVIDLQSPELVGRRLFEAIRRDAECVADLTLNRPNVFFELGARMVANENGARVVRCSNILSADKVKGKAKIENCEGLDVLLGAREYRVSGGEQNQPIAAALGLDSDWAGGSVTRGYAYAIAQNSVDSRQEAGGRSIEALLWGVMEETIGQDRSQNMTYPVLYAEQNQALRLQVRRFAFDATLAYVLFTGLLPPERKDLNRRAIALEQLDATLEDLDLEPAEKERLHQVIATLKGHRDDTAKI